MKKTNKFAIIGVTALATIGLAGLNKMPNKLDTTVVSAKMKAYNHNATSALDNVFSENNKIIIPFIYNDPDYEMTKAIITEEFTKAGLTITSISTGETIGTGTEITVNENSNTYIVLIYGDINGDGKTDILDTLKIIDVANRPDLYSLTGIFFKAADVNNDAGDNDIDALDALKMINFVNMETDKYVSPEPVSDKEKDGIVSIAMENNPTTTTYNYGADSLDLAGATIKATWKSGKEDSIEVTSTMVSGYDLNTAGQQTVTVTHAGQTTNFNIEVLDKIKELELTQTGMKDAEQVTGGYKVETQKEFILGTLKAKELTTGNVSTLTNNQVQIEKVSISSTDSATLDDLTISTEIEESTGNILVKGTSVKEGTYSIELYISYGQEKITLPVQIVAEKNPVIAKITLEKIEDTDVDEVSSTKSIKRKLVIENSKGEVINDKVNNIEFTNATAGLEFIKLNANGQTATAGETVEFIQIATSLEPDADTDATFTVKVTGTKNSKVSAVVQLIIKEKAVVSNVNSSKDEVNLYDTETGEGKQEPDGNIYTMFDLDFTDQYGNPISVTRNDIEEKYSIPDEIKAGKVYIILPLLNIKIDLGGGNTITEETTGGLLTKYYDKDGNPAIGTTIVKKMAIAINLTGPDEVVKESITGKTLKIVVKDNQTIEEIQLEYKPTI